MLYTDEEDGLLVRRRPNGMSSKIPLGMHHMMTAPIANLELRFVIEDDYVSMTFSKRGESPLKMIAYDGDYQTIGQYTIGEEPTTITLYSESSSMVRLMFAGRLDVDVCYHGISKGGIRLPE